MVSSKPDSKQGSLTVVGTGIKFLSHISTETKVYIENADLTLYLVNEPAIEKWIKKNSKKSRTLFDLYQKDHLRKNNYDTITNYILSELSKNIHVCVVTYGHPLFFSNPTQQAVLKARALGYSANALPSVSSEDCLFADLLIDPGSSGCQSFDATDFLIKKRQFDISSHLILYQIGFLGVLTRDKPNDNKKALNVLTLYLKKYYHYDHLIYLYESSQYPHIEPVMIQFPIDMIPYENYSPTSTLYIPPAKKAEVDLKMLNELNIKIQDL